MANLLLVPGVGGNKIQTRFELFGRGREIWLDRLALLNAGLYHLRLSDDGLGSPYYPLSPRLIPGTKIDSYYPPMEDYFRDKGWQISWAVIDWRTFIEIGSAELSNLIVQLGDPDPLRIVAHSRGGLVVMDALRRLSDRGTLGAVKQVVAICCPFGGSYAPVPWLAGDISFTEDASLIWAAAGTLGVLAQQRKALVDAVKSFPAFYELMVNPAAAKAAGESDPSRLYDRAGWLEVGQGLNWSHLSDALKRWLTEPEFPEGVKVDCIVGTGIPTYGGVDSVTAAALPRKLKLDADGDGTVPTWSAVTPRATVHRLPVGHTAALRDPTVLALVDSLLRS